LRFSVLRTWQTGDEKMNQRPPDLETVKTIQGFLQYKSAESLSPGTIEGYRHDLMLWVEHQTETYVDQITPQMMCEYLYYLLTDMNQKELP
jgi:site-specific recombinase XerD